MQRHIRFRLEELAERALHAGMKHTEAVFMISIHTEHELEAEAAVNAEVYGPVMAAKIQLEGARKAFPLMYGYPVMWDAVSTRITGLDGEHMDLETGHRPK